ncbi:MAG TPA: hypothetical protein VKV03_09065 [Candidatus Binataceae bacterium]|nr:hypothetical protein [Candidatus Binataceae bacterium]
MGILNISNIIRTLAIVAALACCGCIDVSSSTPPSTNTTCTTAADGTQTCTSNPTGGSHWSFFL